MDAFLVNCKPGNWETCNKFTIFGFKDTNNLPPLRKGDLILFRISGPNYGLKALWYFEYAKKVVNQKNIHLTDENYTWILNCKKILTLTKRFSEEFQTSSKKSSKITDLYAGGIQKSIVAIKQVQVRDYIFHILKEFKDELYHNINYLGEEVNVNELLQRMLAELVAAEPFPDTDKNQIVEPAENFKEKPDKPDSVSYEKTEKPSAEKKEKSDKKISGRKEKWDKNRIELKEIENKPVIKHEKDANNSVPDLQGKHDLPSAGKVEESEKQISEIEDKVREETSYESVLKNNQELTEPVQDIQEQSAGVSTEKEEEQEKQLPESKVKTCESADEKIETGNEPASKDEGELNYADPEEVTDGLSIEKEEKSHNQISEWKETLTELEEITNESLSEEKTDFAEPVLELQEEPVKERKEKFSKQLSYEQVGERINLPILNYAPLNEKGILLLFGHYMKKLGISHVEEIRTDFPDAVAIRSIGNGRYQRVRVGFEFKSSTFLEKGHDPDECDLIICWTHDWNNCPIEVIELSKVLFDK